MSTEVTTNWYVTVRQPTTGIHMFYVNVIRYNGEYETVGQHSYNHKRSARRAAIALAKKLDVSYRQDLEYTDTPHTFVATAGAAV